MILKNLNFTNFSVFIIFFGIALIEVFKNYNWIEALFFWL